MPRIANPLHYRFARTEEPSGPVHYEPPSGRDLRTQAVQRLQVGLFGLGGMLLMVGLANIVMERARQTDTAAVAAQQAPQPSTSDAADAGSDPLVDMGVAPELPVNKPSPSVKPDTLILAPGNAASPTPGSNGQGLNQQTKP